MIQFHVLSDKSITASHSGFISIQFGWDLVIPLSNTIKSNPIAK